ncbi:MAG: hypothetical protein IPK66_08495 [Rhodospirillales bacterium]|nr:hypothetical protein [Rhodospirillales bacterium]
MLAGLAAGAVLFAAPDGQGAAATPSRPAPRPERIHFDVVRSGAVIGTHDVDFSTGAAGLSVRTHINIAVTLLGVNVFEFRHDGTEVWKNDRLVSFDSKTHDDDSDFFVIGRATSNGFAITNKKGNLMAPADIMVGSFWRPAIAQQTQLIDPQRGRIKEQQRLGEDTIEVLVRGETIKATRYRVSGVTDGWVAYDAHNRWVAAELQKKGSAILYRLPA